MKRVDRKSEIENGGTISAIELSRLSGLTDRRHRQLAEEGYFPPPRRGEYELLPTIGGLFRHFSEQIHAKGDSEAAARKRKLILSGDKIEEELAVMRRDYMKAADIGPALRNLALHQRAVLQRKLEQEIGPKIADRPWEEIRPQMMQLVDELCQIMRDGTEGWLTANEREQAEPAPHRETIAQKQTKGTKAVKKHGKKHKSVNTTEVN